MTSLDIFVCVLGTVDMCFQIITVFVSYRCESFAYNTLFHFGFSQLWSKDFFGGGLLLNLYFLFGILSVKNRKCTLILLQ
jgi:hypothetical protein